MRRRVINRRSLIEVADRARELAEVGVVPTARWSLAQTCQHLALSIEATLINAEVTVGTSSAPGSSGAGTEASGLKPHVSSLNPQSSALSTRTPNGKTGLTQAGSVGRGAFDRGVLSVLRHWFFRRVILTMGYIPRGIPVPDGLYPSDDAALAAELTHLESAIQAFEAAALEPDRAWPAQRFTGPLTATQWRRFHHVHAAHHFAFLTAAPPSPTAG